MLKTTVVMFGIQITFDVPKSLQSRRIMDGFSNREWKMFKDSSASFVMFWFSKKKAWVSITTPEDETHALLR